MRPVEDYAPLLVGDEENPSKATRKPAGQRIAVTVCYCFIMVINGGACGAFGPSLEVFERTTGLSQAVLGGAVMQNRLAKLAGTVVWGYFASRLQKYKPGEEPVLTAHYLMGSALLVSGGCCAVLGYSHSGTTLQLMMIMSGFAYGISDSGANLLILWVWHHDIRRQRVNVAVLNAMFTIGAFVTPMVIAASMHYLRGAIYPAYYCIAVVAICIASVLPLLPNPPPPDAEADAEAAEADGTELTSVASPATDGAEMPGTSSKSKSALSPTSAKATPTSSWVYLGDDPAEGPARTYVMLLAICTLCFFANGCEHTAATWLPSFGIKHRGLGEETMAIMTSNFWTAMSAGRLAWACLSGFITSAWPPIFANTACCVLAAAAMAVPSHALLWSSAMGIGLGVASSFPASMTLPPEMGITMSARMMTTLQLCASFGEMLCPFIMGLVFNYHRYSWFYGLMFVWEVGVAVVLFVAWMLLTRRLPLPAAVVRCLGRSACLRVVL